MQRGRIDGYWDIDGSRDLSGSWTGFTQFTLLEEKPPDGFLWSGKRLTKRQATSRPDRQWPELWTKLRRNAELREKQKRSIEKRPVDNARRLRGIYFIDPEDKEIKETIRNARQKLETPMAPAVPCKTYKKSKNGETRARRMISNKNLRVSWKPSNPRECEWKNFLNKLSWGPCRKKRWQLTSTLQLGTQMYAYASSNEDTRSKSSGGQMGKLEKILTWDKKCQKQIRGGRWSKDEGHKSSFCLTDVHLSFEECWIRCEALEIRRSNCTPSRHRERWFWILCSNHGTRIISISNDGNKSHGSHIQTAKTLRTSIQRSIY